MSEQQEVFGSVVDILERLDIPYMIVGSVASMAYGEPRLTLDMDVVIDLMPQQAQALAASFDPQDYYVDLGSVLEAIRVGGHFNIIHSASGLKVDFFLLQRDAFSQSEFARRRREAFDEQRQASFASPEDIILKKLDYYRRGGASKHLEDIKGMLRISGPELDLDYIDRLVRQIGLKDIWQRLYEESQKEL